MSFLCYLTHIDAALFEMYGTVFNYTDKKNTSKCVPASLTLVSSGLGLLIAFSSSSLSFYKFLISLIETKIGPCRRLSLLLFHSPVSCRYRRFALGFGQLIFETLINQSRIFVYIVVLCICIAMILLF